MWYDLRWMRALFYFGVMIILIGAGITYWNFKIAGSIVICVGTACLVIGFLGIRVHMAVNKNGRRRV